MGMRLLSFQGRAVVIGAGLGGVTGDGESVMGHACADRLLIRPTVGQAGVGARSDKS
jgi:hypothetical protein